MKNLKINHFAVWTGVVLYFVVGFLWYGPLFGNSWMELAGLDMATIEADPAGVGEWLTNVVHAVFAMYTLAWVFVRMNVDSLLKGAGYGLLLGFSWILLASMVTGMFNKDPYALAWITGGYDTFMLTLGGAVLGAWKKYRA